MKKFTSLFALLSCLCVVSAQASPVTIHVYVTDPDITPIIHYWDANEGESEWNNVGNEGGDPFLTPETINGIPFYTITLNTNENHPNGIQIILRDGNGHQTDDIPNLTESEYFITYTTDSYNGSGHQNYYWTAIHNLGISFSSDWSTMNYFEFDTDSKSFVYTLDASELTDNVIFSLRPNEDWAGYTNNNTTNPNSWFEAVDNNEGGFNFSLKHQSYHYDTYKLTATWNPSNNNKDGWTINVEGLNPVYTVVGDAAIVGSSWNTDDPENEMRLEEGIYRFSKRVYLEEDDAYGFKVITNHDYTESWPDNNWVINIEEDGTYDIIIDFDPKFHNIACTFNKVDGVLDLSDNNPFAASGLGGITEAYYERTGITSQWGTLCLPFDFYVDEQDDVTFYMFSELSADERSISFTPYGQNGYIEAGHAVLFKLAPEAEGILYIHNYNRNVVVTWDPYFEEEEPYMTGVFQQFVPNWDVYYISNDNFYYGNNITVNPYRAWIEGEMPNESVAGGAPFRISVDDTEGLQFVEQEDGTVKAYYDLQGRKLNGARKGLVIENGKIIMVK